MKKVLFLLFIVCFMQASAVPMDALPWAEEKHREMALQAENSYHAHYESFVYPVTCEECVLERFSSGTVPIFVYGSLLDKNSAKRSLTKEAMETYEPAVAFGVKRVFDRHVPTVWRWGILERFNDTAMLNLRFQNDYTEIVNGVVVEVGFADLRCLLLREKGYDLVPVPVVKWDDALDVENGSPEISFAYAFMARDENYLNSCINPVPGYALAAKEGASVYGEDFLRLWMATTYLADGETSFEQWEEGLAKDQWINCE